MSKIDELYEIAVSAEELQRRAEEEAARKLAEEEALLNGGKNIIEIKDNKNND